MKLKKIIINTDVKLNYIRHFICINLKKINFIKKVEEFEIESSDESEDENINVSDLEIE